MEVVTKSELTEVIIQLGEDLRAGITRAMEMAKHPAYYTRAEAAEYLRTSPSKLDRLRAEGRLRRAKLGDSTGSAVLYRKVDLDAYVESQLELDKAGAQKAAKRIRLN
jgi:excisionase family DNA binding protein